MLRDYIVVMRNQALLLFGPFDDLEAARQWAESNNPSDDPRWQRLQLDSDDMTHIRSDEVFFNAEAYPVRVIPPTGTMPSTP